MFLLSCSSSTPFTSASKLYGLWVADVLPGPDGEVVGQFVTSILIGTPRVRCRWSMPWVPKSLQRSQYTWRARMNFHKPGVKKLPRCEIMLR
jgi:hypothetical protein